MNCVEGAKQRLPHGEELGALEQQALAGQSFAWGDAGSYWFIANDRFTSTIDWLRGMVRAGLAHKAIAPLLAELAEAERRMRGRRALKFAQNEGYVRSYLEEGSVIQTMRGELQSELDDRIEVGEYFIERWLRGSVAVPAAPTGGVGWGIR